MAALFWLSVAIVAYVYIGYPVLLWVWARWTRRPELKLGPADGRNGGTNFSSGASGSPPSLPGVSIIIAAHNEGARLGARLDNLRSLDYPPARRQIIVVSDGSTDDTARVLASRGAAVDIVEIPHGGKAVALNAGVDRAKFDILVFADARQVFAPDALRQLTAPFADPKIGAVSGELLLDCEAALFSNRRAAPERRRPPARAALRRSLDQAEQAESGSDVSQLRHGAGERRGNPDRRRSVVSTIADGVGMYWRYEKQLRRLESTVGSMLGATGAIYAMRRSLWQPLPAGTILDDVLAPMRVVLSGFRVVFNEGARAFDRAPVDADTESRRKVRTLAGNYQILWLEPRLLLPWRNPVWLQYLSHKIGRLAVPYALLAIFYASVALAGQHPFYFAALSGQVALILLAGYGAIIEYHSRIAAAGSHAHGRASRAGIARQFPARLGDAFESAARARERA